MNHPWSDNESTSKSITGEDTEPEYDFETNYRAYRVKSVTASFKNLSKY